MTSSVDSSDVWIYLTMVHPSTKEQIYGALSIRLIAEETQGNVYPALDPD